MTSDFYRFGMIDRRRFLADAGFIRDDLRIWVHPDGRAVGEGIASALTDEAFFRFLKIGLPAGAVDEDEQIDEPYPENGNSKTETKHSTI
jgi:ribosomal protein S18 acetylase RimI-like enzyme